MGKYQIVDKPPLEPGSDAVTGSTVGPFLDTGAWIQPHPRKRRLYLSIDTVRELAEAAGIVSVGNTELSIAQARAEGALEVVKENLGGDLARVLRRIDDHLRDLPVVAESTDA